MRRCNRSMRGSKRLLPIGANTKNTNKHMNTTLMKITPQVAESLLKKNTRNRPLNHMHVGRLAREMELGNWKLNGSTICVNGDLLIDGQHRLQAVLDSGCTIESLVVEGLSSEVFNTIDTGRRRDGGDTLALIGVKNSRAVTSALLFVQRIVSGKIYYNSKKTTTNAEVESLYAKHPGIEESVRLSEGKRGICPKSILAGLHYLFALRDKEAADQFVEDIKSGKNLSEGDAVYLLRERLVQNNYMKQKLRGEYIAALAIKAWNARRAGKSVSVLKFLDSETFPLIAD